MKIVKMDNKARGITYNNNKIVFVNNALIDEDVDIKITLDKKRYSIADVKKYNIKSCDRIKPKCKYFGFCGGCNLQHLSYENQLKYKLDYLNDMFKPLNVKISKITKSDEFYYRNKITLKVNNKIGFYEINSNNIVEVDNCIIADKNLKDKIDILKKLDTNSINEIILKSFNDKTMIVINSKTDKIKIDVIKDYFDTIYINNKLVYGNRMIATIDNIKYFIAPNAFFQVNLKVARKMFKHIKNTCIKYNAKNILDMYCGCGSISLYISDICNKVLGVEINEQSIKDAIENKKINDIRNVEFICDTTDNIEKFDDFDTIILDPPRSGLSRNLINNILNSKINNIIYVSCDPVTLKRDLQSLSSNYNIREIEAFDMFPQTYHVECISVLEKNT